MAVKEFRSIVICVCIVLFGFLGMGSYFVVGVGQVGVVFNRLNGKTKSYQQGMHFKLPLLTNVTKFDVKTKKIETTCEGASKDLQVVNLRTVLNYHLEYEKVNDLYVKVGNEYEEKVIIPAITESAKSSIAMYPVEKIIVERQTMKENIEIMLKERLIKYNIVLEALNIVDINFSKEFNKVVEEKQIEEQKIKTAQYKRKQAEEDKKTQILKAEAEAKKQALLKQNTSREVIELKWIEKWNGKLPDFVGGTSSIPMVDFRKK